LPKKIKSKKVTATVAVKQPSKSKRKIAGQAWQALILFLIFAFYAVISHADKKAQDSCAATSQISAVNVRSYKISISRDQDHTCQRLEVSRDRKILFSNEGFDNHYSYWTLKVKGRKSFLAIKKFTGGAHCCFYLSVFDMDSEFKQIAQIDGGNFDPEFLDMNHDGIPEIRVADDFLAYEFSDYAHSAFGDVLLKYKDGIYSVDVDAMKKPPLSEMELKKKSQSWADMLSKKDDPNWPPPDVVQEFTDLIFSGQKAMALKILNDAWPKTLGGKEEFVKQYEEYLSRSKFYSEFEKKISL
jgi:hypothetical protein